MKGKRRMLRTPIASKPTAKAVGIEIQIGA